MPPRWIEVDDMNIQWDASGYTKQFGFVHEYGKDVLALLALEAGQSVLDLGCGNGALTKNLSDMGLSASGMDASPDLLHIAQAHYPHLVFTQGDATAFSLSQPVDAVFSNAVFHWIDRERQGHMLRCVHQALKPGGQFVFEMGGMGNNATIHKALRQVFERRNYHYQMPFFFPSIGEYAPMLEDANFLITYAVLFDRPTPLVGQDGLRDFIYMFIKTPFSGISDQEKEEIVEEAVEQLRADLYQNGTWYSDYVRLRMKAIRAQ